MAQQIFDDMGHQDRLLILAPRIRRRPDRRRLLGQRFQPGIRLLLQSLPGGTEVVGESSTGLPAPDLVDELKPDLVLLDLLLPDAYAFEVANLPLAKFQGLKIIMLSAESDLRFVN